MSDITREKTYHREEPIKHKLVDQGDGTFAELVVAKLQDTLDFIASIEIREVGFFIANKDDDASPHYFGYEDAEGAWYIMKWTESEGADVYEYVSGESDYATNWTGRVGLSYSAPSGAF